MPVNPRALGRTGLTVSEIGFGAWGIGGTADGAVGYGPVDDAVSLRTLGRALDLGITFFDTSDLYGYGHSERLLGEALRGWRPRVVIASKVGMLNAADEQDFSPRHIRTALERSLRRLGTDYVDVYQLHDPPVAAMAADDPALVELRRLKQQGTIRVVGISVRSPHEAIDAVRRLGADCVQLNFSLIDQRALDTGALAECGRLGAGVIARTPLCYGFLSGRLDANRMFGDGDHRRRWPAAQLARWADAPGRFEAIRAADSQTAAQFALRFCLSFGEISTVIPGMLFEHEVEENAAASHLGPLAPHSVRAAELVYQQHEFFGGR
ncbi:MAG: aldo/keto reductase [Acidobacteria bacterium]|nr:aldo/keto reductase [Acidobacteriota bacterium]